MSLTISAVPEPLESMLLPREANLCLRSSAHTFSGCCADQGGRCWSPFTCLPPLTLAFLALPRRNPALPSNSISRRFRSGSIPFAIPSMLFRRYAVLRSPWFAGIPFPRYADQCFSASWWRNSIPTRICAVLFRRFAVRFGANPAQIKSFQRPRRLNSSRTNSSAHQC